MMTLDIFCQVVITCAGFMSLRLMASQSPKIRMYGAMVGLGAEPFWLTMAYLHNQIGVMILALVYAVNWWLVLDSNRRALA